MAMAGNAHSFMAKIGVIPFAGVVMQTTNRPVLIYDGDCDFCRYWVGRWKPVTGNRIEYVSSGEAGARFPKISEEKFAESIQMIASDGSVYDGAEAVFLALSCVPGRSRPLALYRKYRPVASITEWVYGIVARNRGVFGWLTRLARRLEPPA